MDLASSVSSWQKPFISLPSFLLGSHQVLLILALVPSPSPLLPTPLSPALPREQPVCSGPWL